MWTTNYTNSTNSTSVPQLSYCGQLFNLKIRHYNQSTPASFTASLSAVITIGLSYPFIVVLNIFIVVAFCKKPALRTRGNIPLGALAVTSLANGAICFPLRFAKEILYQLNIEPNCYLEIFSSSSTHIVALTSLLQVNLLNCERFVGLKFPIWHRVHVTKTRLFKATVFPWFISVIVNMPKLFRDEGETVVDGIAIATTISTMVFAVMIWRVIAERNQVHPGPQPSQPSTTFTNSEKKAAKLAAYLAVESFIIRVVPVIVIYGVLDKQDSPNVAETIKSCTLSLNALLFPIIYGATNSDIRRACLELLKCHCT